MADIQLSGSVGAGGSFAILGRANVEVVGNVDLVLSLAQYSNYFVQVTSDGTSTGVRNVIAPLNEGTTFVVLNKTSEGFAIVLKGPSGTGVTIPPASSALVATDGTNYFTPSAGTGFSPALVLPTIAALGAVSTVAFATSYPAIVQSVGADWTFELAGTLPVDGITVIAATPAGQWWRGATRVAARALVTSTWAIDPVAGNDENTGAPGSAFKTAAEIVRRYGTPTPTLPNGQSVTWQLLNPQAANTDPIFFAPNVSGGGKAVLVGTLVVKSAAFVGGAVTAKVQGGPGQLLTVTGFPAGTAAGDYVFNQTRNSYAPVDSVSGGGVTVVMGQPVPASSLTTPGIPVTVEDNTWATGDTFVIYTRPRCNLHYWSPEGGAQGTTPNTNAGWVQWVQIADDGGASTSRYPLVTTSCANTLSGCQVLGRVFYDGGCTLLGCDVTGLVGQVSSSVGTLYANIFRAGANIIGPAVLNGDNIIHGTLTLFGIGVDLFANYCDGAISFGAGCAVLANGPVWGPASLTVNPQCLYIIGAGTFTTTLLLSGVISFSVTGLVGWTTPITGTFTLNGVTPVAVAPTGGLHFPANTTVSWALKAVGSTPGLGAPFMSAATMADQFTVQSPTAAANDVYDWTAQSAPVPLNVANLDLYHGLQDLRTGARFVDSTA